MTIETVITMTTFAGLPANCPPANAAPCAVTVYRRASGTPVPADELHSYAEMGKPLNLANQCRGHGVSVYADRRDVERKLKAYPAGGGTHIAEAVLTANDGVIAHTPNWRAPDSHHTWWPFAGVDRASLFK